jgi:photosystem II stability/assembly factor-like uncharacterized protein
VVLVVLGGLAFMELRNSDAGPRAWSRLGTTDVHALTFVAGDPQRLLFGHHGGLRASDDGGRTWRDLPADSDAMAVATSGADAVVIAGHDVLAVSSDGGRTFSALRNDLPGSDIHSFARDPADPQRMWAALATGGLFESTDGGSTWTQVRRDNVLNLVAVRRAEATQLLAIDVGGLSASPDGGRTWSTLTTPPTYPMTALAAADGGQDLYAGSTDGLYRTSDGGRTWSATSYQGSVFALAVLNDAVGLVSGETDFYRSDDGGDTFAEPGSR